MTAIRPRQQRPAAGAARVVVVGAGFGGLALHLITLLGGRNQISARPAAPSSSASASSR